MQQAYCSYNVSIEFLILRDTEKLNQFNTGRIIVTVD